MRDRALVLTLVVTLAACGKVRTLDDAGNGSGTGFDASVCDMTSCSAIADGCCPVACNAADDPDCAAVCGNGIIEPSEHCDPLTTCPADCPQVGCTLSTLFDGGTCRAQCVATGTQTACGNGDGCCPGGCNANNDNDCQP